MVTLFRAEGAHDEPGYAGTVDGRTGRYFGTYERATRYLTPDRHLFEVDVDTAAGYNADDHVLVTRPQAETKRHSPRCPCRDHPPCDDPECRTHGIAASLAYQSAFYATHDRTIPAGPDPGEDS